MVNYKNMPKEERMAKRTEILLRQKEFLVKKNARIGASRILKSEKKPEEITKEEINSYLNPFVPPEQPAPAIEGVDKLEILKKFV